jgi:hypothetical protein
MGEKEMSNLQQEMEAFFAEYSKRWNNQEDFSTIIEMWDLDDAPYYRAMEKPGVFTTWEEVKRYLDPARKRELIVALWYEFVNIRPKLVAPDVAVVFFDAEWDIKAMRGPAASGTDPGVAVFKRKADGWKINTYVEACTHPATYKSVFADKEEKVRPAFRKLLAEIEAKNAAANKPA